MIYATVGLVIGTIWVCLTSVKNNHTGGLALTSRSSVFYANEERRYARNRDIKIIESEQNHTNSDGGGVSHFLDISRIVLTKPSANTGRFSQDI